MLTDYMLDCKRFYGDYSIYDAFFSYIEYVTMEQSVAEERVHKKWGW